MSTKKHHPRPSYCVIVTYVLTWCALFSAFGYLSWYFWFSLIDRIRRTNCFWGSRFRVNRSWRRGSCWTLDSITVDVCARRLWLYDKLIQFVTDRINGRREDCRCSLPVDACGRARHWRYSCIQWGYSKPNLLFDPVGRGLGDVSTIL